MENNAPQTMKLNHFIDLLTFSLEPQGQNFYLYNYSQDEESMATLALFEVVFQLKA